MHFHLILREIVDWSLTQRVLNHGLPYKPYIMKFEGRDCQNKSDRDLLGVILRLVISTYGVSMMK